MFNVFTKSNKQLYGYSINENLKTQITLYANLYPEKAMRKEVNVSDTIIILNSDKINLTKKCYIVQHSNLNLYNHKKYKVKENGYFDLLIKK